MEETCSMEFFSPTRYRAFCHWGMWNDAKKSLTKPNIESDGVPPLENGVDTCACMPQCSHLSWLLSAMLPPPSFKPSVTTLSAAIHMGMHHIKMFLVQQGAIFHWKINSKSEEAGWPAGWGCVDSVRCSPRYLTLAASCTDAWRHMLTLAIILVPSPSPQFITHTPLFLHHLSLHPSTHKHLLVYSAALTPTSLF